MKKLKDSKVKFCLLCFYVEKQRLPNISKAYWDNIKGILSRDFVVQFLNRRGKSGRCVLCLMAQYGKVLHFVVHEDFVFIL